MSGTDVQSASIVPDATSHPAFEVDLQEDLPREATINLCDKEGNFKSMDDLKWEIIRKVYESYGEYSATARALKIGRSTIARLKDKHG